MAEVVIVEHADGVATLTLNRPEKMNALNAELRRSLTAALLEVEADASVGVVILTGAGQKAFCAGLDLKELGGEAPQAGAAGSATSTTDEKPLGAITGGALIEALGAMSKPVIGAINGFAITGGFELALACDLLVASEGASFADTHARVGILPGWGLSQRLSRLIGIYRAKELSLTGNYIDARRAEAWGLVNRVVPPDALLPTCDKLARDMLSCDPLTLGRYKRVIDAGFAASFGEGLDMELERSREHAQDLTPERVAERRAGVQARGRSQK